MRKLKSATKNKVRDKKKSLEKSAAFQNSDRGVFEQKTSGKKKADQTQKPERLGRWAQNAGMEAGMRNAGKRKAQSRESARQSPLYFWNFFTFYLFKKKGIPNSEFKYVIFIRIILLKFLITTVTVNAANTLNWNYRTSYTTVLQWAGINRINLLRVYFAAMKAFSMMGYEVPT